MEQDRPSEYPKPAHVQAMSSVAKDIIFAFEKLPKETNIRELMDLFYSIMKKHNIANATLSTDGSRNASNYEWTMAKTLFLDRLASFFEFEFLVDDTMPDELKDYGKGE